ncbi:MAG TPA: OmpA family protein [Acidobacteriota bacterium]|jgi:outer membrane protein OmpA-like peptidoglycan-associated protein|nr:OmpA family protein [Acidobacteriota bacterium]HNU01024.1 OmpA family protein [Acidobacteriota bacterium]HPB26697.1 OmpA family protein [Acidobacteriota bacterium]HQO25686.1 OmpA family protein [Acidobacteriota bacterium]HQP73984.1 OmpA family protein [Acidobacteriota bacterium]
MSRARSLLVLIVFACSVFGAQAQETDVKGSADHPILTRMQNMYITVYKMSEFDQFAFKTGPKATAAVEGKRFEIRYVTKTGNVPPTPVAIIRNHQQAVARIGGTTVYEDQRYTTLKVAKDGKEIWVQVDTAWGKGYFLTIVEKQTMVQEVVASAELFKAGLNTTGHVEVPGIFFDTGKSVLKPESDAAVGEIAKLLQADPALKVYVVGHTDSVAALDLNMKLSQARAEAVVQALVTKHGIAAARLVGRGVGPLCPVASNDTEEGRAKNRRVELVKQ